MKSRKFTFRNVLPYQHGQKFMNQRGDIKILLLTPTGWCLSYPSGQKYQLDSSTKVMSQYLIKNGMIPHSKKNPEIT